MVLYISLVHTLNLVIRLGNLRILYTLAAFLKRLYSFKYERTAKSLAALFCFLWAGLFQFLVLLAGGGWDFNLKSYAFHTSHFHPFQIYF